MSEINNEAQRSRNRAWVVMIVSGVIILVPSLAGFIIKLSEMIVLTDSVNDGSFAVTPIINYLLASCGFFFMLLWAGANGIFRDPEHPKFVMLEQERELDRHE